MATKGKARYMGAMITMSLPRRTQVPTNPTTFTAPAAPTAKQERTTKFTLALLTLAASFVGTAPAQAKTSNFGLGVILGEPTGLSAKWRPDGFSSDHALQFALSYSFNNFFLISGDYLFSFPGAFGHKTTFISQLGPYVGVGGALFFSTRDYVYRVEKRYYVEPGRGSVGLGVRVPLGIEWSPAKPPIGVFIELAPGVGLAPATFLFIEAGVGVRFYF